MVTREARLIPTMEMPTRSLDTVLPQRVVRLDMLLHQQLASLDMVRQDTPSHLQIRQVMISLLHQQLRVAMLHPLQIHSLVLQRGCHHSLLDMAGSGLHEVYFSNFTDSKIKLKTMFHCLCTLSTVRILWMFLWTQ